MARKSFDDSSHPTTKMVMGVLIVFIASIALAGLLRSGAGEGLASQGKPPTGLLWGVTALLGSCLAVGLVWTVNGIRATFLPTSLLYRLTDLPGLLDRLTGSR